MSSNLAESTGVADAKKFAEMNGLTEIKSMTETEI